MERQETELLQPLVTALMWRCVHTSVTVVVTWKIGPLSVALQQGVASLRVELAVSCICQIILNFNVSIPILKYAIHYYTDQIFAVQCMTLYIMSTTIP